MKTRESRRDEVVAKTLLPDLATTLAVGMERTVVLRQKQRTATLASTPSPHERFGEEERFEVLSTVGAGGMGLVVRARDTKLERQVAIKFLFQHESTNDQVLQVLRQEAMATAKLNHENIVSLFDLGSWQGRPFLVMEFVEGETLSEMMERQRPSPLRSLEILTEVARGLEHAHERGIVHRDLKPSNIFIRKDGRAKILDFGIALFEMAQSEMGGDRPLLGTPAYMAPEQWRQERQDGRTDIWAFGIILYEMLIGQRPFPDENIAHLAKRALSGESIPRINPLRLRLPAEVDLIIRKCTAHRPDDRFQTVGALLDALVSAQRAAESIDSPDAHRGLSLLPAPGFRPLTSLACTLTGVGDIEDGADVEQITEAFSGFNEICARRVRQHNGRVLHRGGGRTVACFGYPAMATDDAAQAARTALAIDADVKELAGRLGGGCAALGVSSGIHSGMVIVEACSDDPSAPPVVHGYGPLTAGSLSEAAPPGVTLVSEGANRFLRGAFVTRPRGAERLAGVSKPIRIYEVIEEQEEASRTTSGVGPAFSPLVGRERELETIMGAWASVKDGDGHLLLVKGEAGIGKSRIVQAARERLVADGALRLECRCWPSSSSSAFHPIIELMHRALRTGREDSMETRALKIEQFLTSLDIPLPENVQLLASLLSVSVPPRYPRLALMPVLQKERTIALLHTILRTLAAQQPVLFIVEDIHWLDHSSMELIAHLAERLEGVSLFLLLSSRPEGKVPWQEGPDRRALFVERVSPRTAAALVASVAGDDALPPEVVAGLVARTEGVPLFIEELTRVVVERLDAGEGAGPELLPDQLPVTLHDALRARLDRILPEDIETVQVGAALGKSFNHSMLAACASVDEETLRKSLARLRDQGLLWLRGRGEGIVVEFHHALIQEVAYQSILRARRQALHRRIAEVMEQKFSHLVEASPELLGWHHAEAGNHEKAVAYYARAGELATQRSANVEAINHYNAALKALSSLPAGRARAQQELRLNIALGTPLMSTRGFSAEEVQRTFARARDLASEVGDDPLQFPVVRGLWYYYFTRGDLVTSEELARQMVAIGQRIRDADSEMVGERLLGATYFVTARLAESVVQFDKVIEFYRGGNDLHLITLHGLHPRLGTLAWLLWSQWYTGHADRSLKSWQTMVDVLAEVDHPHSAAFSLGYAAAWRTYRREPDEVMKVTDRALLLCQEHRLSLWLAWSSAIRGWAQFHKGDHDGGFAQLRRGVAAWRATGSELGVPYLLALLAEASLERGEIDQGLAAIAEGLELGTRTRDRYYEPELHRLRGVLLTRARANPDEAEGAYRRALSLAVERGARSLALRSACSLAKHVAARGSAAEAAAIVRAQYAGIEEGHETEDMQSAASLLRELEWPS